MTTSTIGANAMKTLALALVLGATVYGVAPAAAAPCSTTTTVIHAKRAKMHRVHGKLRPVFHIVRGHRRPVMVAYDKSVTRSVCQPATSVAPATSSAPSKVRAKLDPSFTQDPSNPLAVTYSYNAGAFDEHGTVALPEGVLTLYSDGTLECSINVGGSVEGGTCPVLYEQTGAHTIVVTYESGSTTVTETSVEQIEPFTTATMIEATYSPLPAPELEGQNPNGSTFWLAGSMTVTAHTTVNGQPAPGATTVTCDGVTLDGTLKVGVTATRWGLYPNMTEVPQTVNLAPATGNTLTLPVAEVEAGTPALTASYAGQPGYAPSSATTPVHFSVPAWAA